MIALYRACCEEQKAYQYDKAPEHTHANCKSVEELFAGACSDQRCCLSFVCHA